MDQNANAAAGTASQQLVKQLGDAGGTQNGSIFSQLTGNPFFTAVRTF